MPAARQTSNWPGVPGPLPAADLLITGGDPLEEPRLLTDASRIWLVPRLGVPVAGQALERDIGVTANEPVTG